MIALATSKGWDLYQMDMHNTFLHGDPHKEVYMEMIEGFKSQGTNKICKLLMGSTPICLQFVKEEDSYNLKRESCNFLTI